MPKRLREHMRAKEIAREAETAPYEWPCVRCGKPFLPHRMPEFMAKVTGREYEQFCSICQIENLIDGLCDSPEDAADFRRSLKGATED